MTARAERKGREAFATPEPVSHTGAMNLAGFRAVCDDGWRRVNDTPGFLSEREARFLMLAAAAAPADGAIVEIGSFKGRSTVGLAYVARCYGLGNVVAIDPHTSPSTTDPDLGSRSSSYDEFQENLRREPRSGSVVEGEVCGSIAT